MNRKMINLILGRIMLTEAMLMLPSVLIGVGYGERAALAFVPPIVLLALIGLLMSRFKPKNTRIFARDGFFIVAAAWVLVSVFGAIPFYLSGFFPTVWDAFFEIVSGFTTTGASVLADPEALPYCLLFWRSFSHWIGGMGVLVFVLAIAPLSEDRSLYLMQAEMPGPTVGKLSPRTRDTALILYAVYTAMTALLILLLVLGKMPLFDAVCNAFATAGTGGFAVRTAGIAYYNSPYIEWVLGVFMFLFGINFNLYYLILAGKAREAVKSEELRWYVIICVFSTALIALNTWASSVAPGATILNAFFQVSSIMTTTGFATVDFALWPQFSQHLLVILMIVGACAGSTGGGFKVSRVLLLCKSFGQEMRRMIHPRVATSILMDGKKVDYPTMHGTRTYCVVYVMLICLSTLLLSLDGFDMTTNLSAELACINNIGPGLALVGPMSNFSMYSPLSKVLLSVNMLLGRLEILPLIVLFSPSAWRRR